MSLIGKTPSDGPRRFFQSPRLQMSQALTDELGEADAVLGGDHLSCLLGGKPLRDRKFADSPLVGRVTSEPVSEVDFRRPGNLRPDSKTFMG